mgnify:CR=1 FL=1
MNTTRTTPDDRHITPPLIWGLFAAVVLLAAGLRWVNFAQFPPGLWWDEAYSLEGARRILDEGEFRVYYAGKHGEPAIFWLSALALRLGAGHLAPRWVSSFSGVATVVLLFFAVRDVLRKMGRAADWVALGSAGVLATNYVFLFYTRMSWQAALAAPFFVLTVWLFWRGLDRGRLSDFVIAGVAAAAAQYTSVSARVLPIVAVLVLGVWLVARERSTRWWARWRGLLAMGVAATVVYLPMAVTFLTHPGWFGRRLETAASREEILSNMVRTLAGWVVRGDAGFHSLPGRPIFLFPMAALWILGCLVALWHWRKPAYTLWLAWLVGCLPGGFLSNPTPMFYRFLTAVPAAAALCAVGGYWLWERVSNLLPKARRERHGGQARGERHGGQARVVVAVGLVGILAFSTGTTLRDYFNRWGSWDKLFEVMDVGKWRAAEVIMASPAEEKLLVTVPERFEPSISYATHTRSVYPHVFDGERCFVYPADTTRPTRYVSAQGYERRSQAYLAELYPDLTPIIDPVFSGMEPYFVEYLIPAGASTPILGQLDRPLTYGEIVLAGVQPATREIKAGAVLDVTLTWRARHDLATSYTIFVHLLDGSPDQVETPLRAQHDTIPCLNSAPTQTWRPDEYIVEVHSLPIPADLKPADYLLGIGVYNSDTLERMIPDADRVQWNEAIVDTITVTAP